MAESLLFMKAPSPYGDRKAAKLRARRGQMKALVIESSREVAHLNYPDHAARLYPEGRTIDDEA